MHTIFVKQCGLVVFKSGFPVYFSVNISEGRLQDVNTSKSRQCRLRLEFTNVATKNANIMLLLLLLLYHHNMHVHADVARYDLGILLLLTRVDPLCSASGCWTEWFDRDHPSGTGDWEILTSLRSENPGKICPTPVSIEVETTTGLSIAAAGEVIAV